MSPTEMAYRKTAIGGASGFGLLVALYDTLAGDLRRAADAERDDDLEKRTRELTHALLVVAHLEDRVTRGSGGELADQLTGFYRSLRRKIIEAQAKRSAAILEDQMNLVLKLREAWQGLEMRGISARPEGGSWDNPASYAGATGASMRQGASHWSA